MFNGSGRPPPRVGLQTVLADAISAELRKLRRGAQRLVLGLAVVWFVFWTFAYVLQPSSSLKPEPTFEARIIGWRVVVPCVMALLVVGSWVVLGFRPDPDRRDPPASLTRARLRIRLSEIFTSQAPVGRTKP